MNPVVATASPVVLPDSKSPSVLSKRAGQSLIFAWALWTGLATAPAAEIHDVAGAGDVARLKTLLAEHPDWLNAKDDDDWTPLDHALFRRGKDTVVALLAAGADVQTATRTGSTPLHIAPTAELAGLLLARQAKVDAADTYGSTPLHDAASTGRKELAELLLANHAAVDARTNSKKTPLLNAVMQGHKDLVELLLAHGADLQAKDKDGHTPLLLAEKAGNPDMIALLFRLGAVPAAGEDLERIIQLANLQKATALIRRGKVEAVKTFLEANPSMVRAKDRSGVTLLHIAGMDLAAFLLDHGADVNARDNNQSTPLHGVATLSSMDEARLLLARGADVNARNKFGGTPLHNAAIALNGTQMMELLLAMGADIKARDEKGNTALHLAVFNVPDK